MFMDGASRVEENSGDGRSVSFYKMLREKGFLEKMFLDVVCVCRNEYHKMLHTEENGDLYMREKRCENIIYSFCRFKIL